MKSAPATVDIPRLRRLALKRQGLTVTAPFGRGKRATTRAINHLGYVQIDTISVVQRAHHHVLTSRNSDHREAYLDAAMAARDLFEYWFHAAAYLPMAHYRFALPRMLRARATRHPKRSRSEQRTERDVRARIAAEGPLAARDFDGSGGGGGWWDWKPTKVALERMFYEGELMVAGRAGFQKRFDLPERVLPAGLDTRPPSPAEEAAHLIDQALRTMGYATVAEASYLRRSAPLRRAVERELCERSELGALIPLRFADGRALWVDAEGYEGRRSTLHAEAHVLSPFDNLVIQRRRLSDLFDFDYQLECYVPAARRQHGYYVLPILNGERFVARLDAKLDRKTRSLNCKRLSFEPAANRTDEAAVAQALARYGESLGAERIELPATIPGCGALRAFKQGVRKPLESGRN
ncbi:MAG: crosslink repair DNA glycosylase YcaQ family protein [Pseudomonadota bacterium]